MPASALQQLCESGPQQCPHRNSEKEKKKKTRKSPDKGTVSANMGENPAPQPGQWKEFSRQTLDIPAFSSQLLGEQTPRGEAVLYRNFPF